MSDHSANSNAPAQAVKRLREQTGFTWLRCKQLLETLTPAQLQEYLVMLEAQRGERYLHDPIEDDPAIRPLFLAACEEAPREIKVWQERRLAKLEQSSPAVADLARSGRGLCHRYWIVVKALMLSRHNIEWRSPREMNPEMTFD